MKKALIFLVCCSCFADRVDFRKLMGSSSFIKTQEDEHNLALYRTLFDGMMPLETAVREERIPKVIHFVWIGPYEIPKKSEKMIRTWISKHPGWKFKLWTDRPRAIRIRGLEQVSVDDLRFSRLHWQYEHTLSLGEKSHILRFEILHNEGGIYVDGDAGALQSFELFTKSLDFFVSLEPFHSSLLSSSVIPALHVIGCSPRHPILGECLSLIASRWENYEQIFNGDDADSYLYRLYYRTVAPFEEAIKLQGDREEYRNIVFPAAYFSTIDETPGIYVNHDRRRSWLKGKTKFEREVHKRIETLDRNQYFLLISSFVTLFFALIIFTLIFLQRRAYEKK